jgi:hypothetical protein
MSPHRFIPFSQRLGEVDSIKTSENKSYGKDLHLTRPGFKEIEVKKNKIMIWNGM